MSAGAKLMVTHIFVRRHSRGFYAELQWDRRESLRIINSYNTDAITHKECLQDTNWTNAYTFEFIRESSQPAFPVEFDSALPPRPCHIPSKCDLDVWSIFRASRAILQQTLSLHSVCS